MNKIKHWILAIIFVSTMGGATLAVAAPQTASAACSDRLLTFPAWFKGLTTANCEIKSPSQVGGLSNFIWTIALNIIEFILQLVGYIAVGFIIYGGFKYMTSAGSPDGMVKARKIIMNAVIGLLISIFSVAMVNVISGAIR
ncbi:MAG TPA: pilin [Candidatus Saccharimonadales bacterium]|nr:pilin [Candidatus Saccharimonadales bacterium]